MSEYLNHDIQSKHESLIGQLCLVSGQPYSVFTKDGDYFFDECKPVYDRPMTVTNVGNYEIPLSTHPHVPDKFGSFIKIDTVDEYGDTYFFHADDVGLEEPDKEHLA